MSELKDTYLFLHTNFLRTLKHRNQVNENLKNDNDKEDISIKVDVPIDENALNKPNTTQPIEVSRFLTQFLLSIRYLIF